MADPILTPVKPTDYLKTYDLFNKEGEVTASPTCMPYKRLTCGAFVCDTELLTEVIQGATHGASRLIDKKIEKMDITGARIVILRDVLDTEWTSTPEDPTAPRIVIPATTAQKDPPGSGWVVSVGPAVGKNPMAAGHPYPVSLEHPVNLLYRHVIMGMYSGKELKTDNLRQGGFETDFLVMTDRDIWAVDHN